MGTWSLLVLLRHRKSVASQFSSPVTNQADTLVNYAFASHRDGVACGRPSTRTKISLALTGGFNSSTFGSESKNALDFWTDDSIGGNLQLNIRTLAFEFFDPFLLHCGNLGISSSSHFSSEFFHHVQSAKQPLALFY